MSLSLLALMTTAPAAAVAPAEPVMPKPAAILAETRRVADWQLANRTNWATMPAARKSVQEVRDWQQATFWIALTELANRDKSYAKPLLDLGRAEKWQMGDLPFHADDQLIPIPKPHPATVCNTMWALTDFTEANGATRLVPGSHLLPNPDFGGTYDTVPAEMAKGSVLVWHGSLWHGGGANTTDERRVGIAMNYCAGYIRQQENQQLGIPTAIARTFPTRLQQLVGYSVYSALIGHIDKQDPRTLLLEDDQQPAGMVWDAAPA